MAWERRGGHNDHLALGWMETMETLVAARPFVWVTLVHGTHASFPFGARAETLQQPVSACACDSDLLHASQG